MKPYSTLIVERDGSVDWVTLNRPAALNAITAAMTEEMHDYFAGLVTDFSVRAVVLRGAGRAFCAGLDLKEGPPHAPAGEARGPHASLAGIVKLMRACPQPIISLVHGPACGGGFIFALASDIRIAGESARMNAAFITIGLSGCELGISYFLPRMVGLSVAAELMYTGDFIDAKRALSAGLVSRVVPDDTIDEAARPLLASMLKASPQGLRATKHTLNLTQSLGDLAAVITIEEHAQRQCMQGPEFQSALRRFAKHG